MNPRVSVLMPVRNGLPWLREALEGLASQTLADFELLILEDGSTDGTADFLAAWHDDRMRVIPTGGVGISAALNVGLQEASAPLIARQDADDVSAPQRLEAQVDYLAAHADIGVLGTAAEYIDGHGLPVDNEWVQTIRRQQDVAVMPEQIRELMPLTCCVTHGSVMARTALLRAAGGYRQDAAPAEDYDLWLRLLSDTQMAKLPDRLYRYRVHDGQVSARARQQQLLKTLSAKFEYARRLCPQLPSPARLVVVGAGRGADCYRALASSHGFHTVPGPRASGLGGRDSASGLEFRVPDPGSRVPDPALDSFDVLIVASFADVDAYARAIAMDARSAEVIRIGNFFIARRWARRQAA